MIPNKYKDVVLFVCLGKLVPCGSIFTLCSFFSCTFIWLFASQWKGCLIWGRNHHFLELKFPRSYYYWHLRRKNFFNMLVSWQFCLKPFIGRSKKSQIFKSCGYSHSLKRMFLSRGNAKAEKSQGGSDIL